MENRGFLNKWAVGTSAILVLEKIFDITSYSEYWVLDSARRPGGG